MRRSRRFRSRPAVAGFIAVATCHLNLLVTVAGEDRVCETLRMAALDASLYKGVRRMTEPRQHIFYMSKNWGGAVPPRFHLSDGGATGTAGLRK